ncbi:dynamin-binding protein [Plakobranchus ocellatus]|uniref:Dynamin-binding protein n=1 Tax=Plakobranchus ocellatus TaxID=259542 RepID=A0AAV3Y8I5_9GAST|nr:dynamin-binding protein [Plakobranchus ocellatus]
MTMFHIQYPDSKTFLTWDEIGCLCRALGLPVDLFQRYFPTDVYELMHDDDGIAVKTINRLFEMNLLQKALHRTYNMHTADWNVCVIKRALYMLEHRVLDFEGLHDVRVAYGTYEHIDMKGLLIHKHILLRTLKMCGRSIAPLKLMHRIKHMKGEFEEKGRIQLYEFFNLIVWCDLYTAYDPKDMESSSGKEEDLFKLVDFERLLSHHDERMAAQLNAQFLAEEWDFGMEALGSKEMFKEPPVYNEARIRQAKFHKQNYRALKKEVNQSQKRLYRAYAGSIRSRPISAPDLDNYRHHDVTRRHVESSAQEAYESVRRRLHSAPSKASSQPSFQPPHILINSFDHERPENPQVVTPSDLSDVRRKMEDLQFNINTLDSRCKLQVENEMEFYIPGYLEKLANRKPEDPPLPEPERKERHWTSKIINNLAYPRSNLKPSHAKNCDARYRGWLKANSRPGYHAIITSHTHDNSDKGRMFARMEQTSLYPVQYTHQDYVVRYTPKTWPGLSSDAKVLTSKPGSRASKSQKVLEQAQPTIRFRSLEGKDENAEEAEGEEQEGEDKGTQGASLKHKKPLPDLSFFHNKYLSDVGDWDSAAPLDTQRTKSSGGPEKEPSSKQQLSYPRGLEMAQKRTIQPAEVKSSQKPRKTADGKRQKDPSRQDLAAEVGLQGSEDVDWPADVPIPHMEHSAPKLVGVGQIGTIALLENIEESRDLEDKFEDRSPKGTEDQQEESPENETEEEESEEPVEITRPATHSGVRRRRKVKGRPSKSQPSPNQQVSEAACALRMRPTHSAPQRRTRVASPRQGVPSKPRAPGTGATQGKPRLGSAGHVHHQTDSDSLVQSQKSKMEAPQGETSSSYTTSSPRAVVKGFRAMRGSVTSEEEEFDQQVRKSSAVEEQGRDSKRKPKASEEINGLDLQVELEDDQSSYSDAMTIASSDGLSDLPASPPAGSKGLPINLALNELSLSSTTPKSAADALHKVMNAPKIHFDLINIRCGLQANKAMDSVNESDATSPGGQRETSAGPVRHSSAKERKNSLVIHYDLREYLSDSEYRRPTFSKETRARLVGRVENAISPDLKHKLMAGDPGVVIQAS